MLLKISLQVKGQQHLLMNNIFSISLAGDWFLLKCVRLSCWHVSAHFFIFMSACITVVYFMLGCTNFGF